MIALSTLVATTVQDWSKEVYSAMIHLPGEGSLTITLVSEAAPSPLLRSATRFARPPTQHPER